MIFRIKHSWLLTLGVTLAWVLANYCMGAWRDFPNGHFPMPTLLLIGIGGGLVALAINGALHETFRRVFGSPYMTRMYEYSHTVLDGMRWPEYVMGGVMAALAEEPFFRGVVLSRFDDPVLGIGIAAIVFAICHWMRLRFLGFWLWALWEGVLFGILAVFTGSLLVPMIAHGLHDVIAYCVLRVLTKPERFSYGR